MSKIEFEQHIRFTPAWDRRHPDPKKNYGIRAVHINFWLKGPKGVISFILYTNWMLPDNEKETHNIHDGCHKTLCHPLPADIGYHSYKPMYEGETKSDFDCQFLGQPCYHDGSALRATAVFDVLRREGDDGLWKALESEYLCQFENEGSGHRHECLCPQEEEI